MKKLLVTAILFCLAFAAAVAEENSDMITLVEGTTILERDGPSRNICKIRTADGTFIRIDLPNRELVQLKIRENDKISVMGVHISATKKDGEHILARAIEYRGQKIAVKEPVQVSAEDLPNAIRQKAEDTAGPSQEQEQFQNWMQRQLYFQNKD